MGNQRAGTVGRRDFLRWAGAAGAVAALPRSARALWPRFQDRPGRRPFFGLAEAPGVEQDAVAEVRGRIPPDLRGTLYRNGPGRFERDGVRKRCLLDGDGMIHAFRVGDDGVRYRSRFVRTERFVEEEAAGRYLYASWTTAAPPDAPRPADVRTSAGVHVQERNGRLFALEDMTVPYELKPGTLETVGRNAFGIEAAFGAHPKLDGRTGEWVHLGLEGGIAFRAHLVTLDPSDRVASHGAWTLERTYFHDFFVSERWIVLNVMPVRLALFPFLMGGLPFAQCLRWQPGTNRLVVFPRAGSGSPGPGGPAGWTPVAEMDAPPTWMWHSVQAVDRGSEIVLDFVGYDSPDHFLGGRNASLWAVMDGRLLPMGAPGTVRRWVVSPSRKSVRTEEVLAGNHEFPTVHPRAVCHEARHAYLVRGDRPGYAYDRVVRLDLRTGRDEVLIFGTDRYCGEPILAPRPGREPDPATGVEPGWLLVPVYDQRVRRSYLAVLDAEHVADGPVAEAWLGFHLPITFHGSWRPA